MLIMSAGYRTVALGLVIMSMIYIRKGTVIKAPQAVIGGMDARKGRSNPIAPMTRIFSRSVGVLYSSSVCSLVLTSHT